MCELECCGIGRCVGDPLSARHPSLPLVPTRMDVLFGRGRPIQENPGNVRLQMVIEVHKARYQQAEREDKARIAALVTNAIRMCGIQPGRFLKRKIEGDDNSPWIEASEDEINTKVRHGLRSKIRSEPWPTTKDFLLWQKKDPPFESKTGSSSPQNNKRKTPVDRNNVRFLNVDDGAIENVLSSFQASFVKANDAKRRKLLGNKSSQPNAELPVYHSSKELSPPMTEFSFFDEDSEEVSVDHFGDSTVESVYTLHDASKFSWLQQDGENCNSRCSYKPSQDFQVDQALSFLS